MNNPRTRLGGGALGIAELDDTGNQHFVARQSPPMRRFRT
jgi:hypothetical protein